MGKLSIGISLWSLQQLSMTKDSSLEDILNVIKQMDVSWVDFMDEYLPIFPHNNLLDLYNLRKLFDKIDVHMKTSWVLKHIAGELLVVPMEKVLQHFELYCVVHSLLGCEILILPFNLNMPGITHDQAYDMFVRFFDKAIPICEEYKIKVAVNPSRIYAPPLALKLCRQVNSPYLTIAPDLEAWRLNTSDIPLVHAELPGIVETKPLSVSLFEECLPYSPSVHFKQMGYNEDGDDYHFPIKEIMAALVKSSINHHLVVEYEGWIPDINPHLDPIVETKKSVAMIRKYEKMYLSEQI
jgi:sugar phosphate isomerase/epimerase